MKPLTEYKCEKCGETTEEELLEYGGEKVCHRCYNILHDDDDDDNNLGFDPLDDDFDWDLGNI